MPLKQDLCRGSPSTDPHYNEAAGSYRLCNNRPKGNTLEISEASLKPSSLPIDSLLASIVETVRQYPITLLEAEPGAGKTTRVPLRSLMRGSLMFMFWSLAGLPLVWPLAE